MNLKLIYLLNVFFKVLGISLVENKQYETELIFAAGIIDPQSLRQLLNNHKMYAELIFKPIEEPKLPTIPLAKTIGPKSKITPIDNRVSDIEMKKIDRLRSFILKNPNSFKLKQFVHIMSLCSDKYLTIEKSNLLVANQIQRTLHNNQKS
jgi:hypothetical protein